MTTKDLAPESEEHRYRIKCKELKRRIDEVDQSNELATLAINRTKKSIRRLRLEYSILLERLEENAIKFPEDTEEMSPPPTPSLDLSDKKGATKKQKKATGAKAVVKNRIRDPNLPKRPTNAYLIFCELEKERIKQETGDDSLASVQDLGKTLVEAWKNLDEEGKKPYQKLYEDCKEKYRKEMAVYNSRKLEGTASATPADTEAEMDIDAEGDGLEDQENEDTDKVLKGGEEDDKLMSDRPEIPDLNTEPPSAPQSEPPSELHSEPPSEPNFEIKEEVGEDIKNEPF